MYIYVYEHRKELIQKYAFSNNSFKTRDIISFSVFPQARVLKILGLTKWILINYVKRKVKNTFFLSIWHKLRKGNISIEDFFFWYRNNLKVEESCVMAPSLTWIVFTVCTCIGIISSKSRPYTAKPDYDDMISTIDLLGEYHAESLCGCSAMCDVSCSCFGFHPYVNECRTHRSCDVVNMTSFANGWKYYELDRK